MEDTQPESTASRQQIAAEVLKLGETLVDDLIDAASSPPADDTAADAYPVVEVRAAADRFFEALRLLLDLEPAASTPPQEPAA
jgi:hypothetical protein